MLLDSTTPPVKRVSRTWLIAGVLVTIAIILTGGTFAVLSLFSSGPLTEEQQNQTYQRGAARIEFDVDAGDITVAAGEPGQVVVERHLRWRKQKPTTDAVWEGETLRLKSRCPDEKDCTVAYTVRVPAGVAVRAYTVDGAVAVRDVTGELDLRNESGDIEVRGSAGPVRIRGDAGNVTGFGLASAAVEVQTVDGDVSLSFTVAPDTARVALTAGSITIAVPRAGSGVDGYHVQATTSDGQRKVEVAEDSAGKHAIHASIVDGDVTVRYA